jgi:TolB-like protein/Flp pilus assembly protein TadD
VTDTPAEREDEGAWVKLRRRKVVQWGLAYAAGAWVLLQAVALVRDTFGWSHTIQQVVMLLLLIGLPVALVLAWYHGDRGHQRVTRSELAILTVLLLLGGGALWLYSHRSTPAQTATTSATTAPTPTTVPADTRPSIAVLPFENRSDQEKDAFFVDGIHDDILTQLTKIGAMKVIARTSVEQFRNTKLTTKEIGEKLGVTRVLEGGVQRAGNRVRVTVQLIDTSTDGHLWAENYDRELTAANIFAIQSEVATAIAAALNATLTAGEKARVAAIPTQNLEAWEAYQLGQQRMAKRTSEALAEAETFFRKAIDLDPKFALAWVGLADTLDLQIQYSGAPRAATLASAEDAVAKALELDPNLAEAWASSAAIATDRWQFDRAEPMFHRAIELSPNYAPAYHWLAVMVGGYLGRYDEALVPAEKAVALDPLSAVINASLGSTLMGLGRFDEAEARYRRAIEIDPSMSLAYATLGQLKAYGMNRFAEAAPLLEKAVQLDPGSPRDLVTLARLHLDLGNDIRASHLLESGLTRWPDSDALLDGSAYSSLYRGDRERAKQDARKLFDLVPVFGGLQLLRNGDLLAGHPELARARYAKVYPELLNPKSPRVDAYNCFDAVDFSLVLQHTGEGEAARVLLDRSEPFLRAMPRLGVGGYGIADVQIHALRGDKAKALAALREAEKAGWRGPYWRYYRDFDPNLASIRNEPEFKAVFADIERDMARQRAELAKRPKDPPLDLSATVAR